MHLGTNTFVLSVDAFLFLFAFIADTNVPVFLVTVDNHY